MTVSPKYLDSASLLGRFPMGRTTLWRIRQRPDFPKPVKLAVFSNKKMWIVAEVEAWFDRNTSRCEPSPEPAHLRAARGLPQ